MIVAVFVAKVNWNVEDKEKIIKKYPVKNYTYNNRCDYIARITDQFIVRPLKYTVLDYQGKSHYVVCPEWLPILIMKYLYNTYPEKPEDVVLLFTNNVSVCIARNSITKQPESESPRKYVNIFLLDKQWL